MKNLKKSQLILIAALAIVVVAFVVYRITVRPPSEDLSPEARVAAILDKGGCLDCHSANPDLPFYADMPFIGDMVKTDAEEGYRAFDVHDHTANSQMRNQLIAVRNISLTSVWHQNTDNMVSAKCSST